MRYSNGRPYQVGSVERMCRLWGEAAEVANCTPHRWRHTFATTLLRQGTPLEVIQKVLGHASITTTQVYAQVADEAEFRAMLGMTHGS